MKKLFLLTLLSIMPIISLAQTIHYDSTYQESYIYCNSVYTSKTDLYPTTRLSIQYPNTITWRLRDSLGYIVKSGTINIQNILSQLGTVQDSIFMELTDSIILDYTVTPPQPFIIPNGK